jgi:hypothetical protein
MAAEAKDVGILAMDIYFPPNCVLQVPSPHSHSPSAFPQIRRRRGHRAGTRARAPRLFDDSKAGARAGGVDTTTRFAWLRGLFTVAAGSPAGWLLVPVGVLRARVAPWGARDGGTEGGPPRLQRPKPIGRCLGPSLPRRDTE